MEVNAPSGLPIVWFPVNQVGVQTWGKLKARLTGKKNEFAGKYYSFVGLTESEADRLIENIKKSGKHPVLNDESVDKLEMYQHWLVDTYLKSSSPSYQSDDGDEDDYDDYEEDEEEDFEPFGLEEILGSIREEASREKSLAIYDGTRSDDLVEEEVDERILRLLGLEDVFDIDYSTYMTLLRAKMAEARMVDNKLSTDESMLLTDEFKRVKGKVGRFKLKRKKISTEDFGNATGVEVSKSKYFLTGKAVIPQQQSSVEGNERLLKNIITISETVGRILDILKGQNELLKKSEETERQRRENLRRRKAEDDLESGISKIVSTASKLLSPVKGIFDRILNFILYTFLGRAFTDFIKWFNNPKNKERVDVLKRFLKDWWPSLLGALILFTTPFGKFVRTFVGSVTKLTYRLAKFGIPKLAKLIASNPKTAALVAAGTAAVGAGLYMQSQRENRDKELQSADPNYGKNPGPMKSTLDFGSMGGFQFRGGGMIPSISANDIAFNQGGYIDEDAGVDITGAGPDTQLIAAQPGEIVISKKAVDKYGAGFFLNLNKSAGGTNVPKFVNNIQLAQGGGYIGKAAHHLQKDEALSSLTKGVNDFIKPGGRSTVSKINWNSINPNTPIHAYKDSVGQPTIGWGSTFYDNILKGKKPVRMGDVITKKQADNILHTNINNLAKVYKNEFPFWNKMSDAQKAGVLVVGYNAPNGPIGSYPNLTKSLKAGDMISAARNVIRGGPSQFRLELEKKLLLSGPKDLSKVQEPQKPKPAQAKPAGSKGLMQSITDDEGLSRFLPKPIRTLLAPQSKVTIPEPPVSSNTQAAFVQLPDVVQQISNQPVASAGTKVPNIQEQFSSTQKINASIYGIG